MDFQLISMCSTVVSVIVSNIRFFVLPYVVIPNQRHRQKNAKPAISLSRDAVKENDEPARLPPSPAVKGQSHILPKHDIICI